MRSRKWRSNGEKTKKNFTMVLTEPRTEFITIGEIIDLDRLWFEATTIKPIRPPSRIY